MTTITTRHESKGNFKTLLLVLVVGFMLAHFAIGGVEVNVDPHCHAALKHGVKAIIAMQAVAAFGGPGHDCPDGRTRWGLHLGPQTWAVVVREGERLITAFLTDDGSYVQRMLDPCQPPLAGAH